MVGNILMVLTGLCILPSCSPQPYLVKEAMTWDEAQRYCREKYTDLVTINSEEDMIRLSHMLWGVKDEDVWIGLYGDFNNWKLSLERKGFYSKEEAEFHMWASSEPNHNVGRFACVDMVEGGGWADNHCSIKNPFICYSEFSETRFIFVEEKRNWTDAQRYCRKHYTDLARARNRAENDEMRRLAEGYTYIGMYRESWKWSDGQPMQMTSFSNWKSEPNQIKGYCVTTTHSTWNARPCNNKYAFVCSEVATFKQTMKVMLRKSDSSVDLEEMHDSILQQFNQRLEDHGLGGQVKLRWRVQPDGKIFHLKEEEEES